MPSFKLNKVISEQLTQLKEDKRLKGRERVIVRVIPPEGEYGYRYELDGFLGRTFLKMDSNSYLGLNMNKQLAQAEHQATMAFGVGPGAVRFIDGSFEPHIALEKALAGFHHKEACQIFSSAYAAVCGVISPLVNNKTFVISDELNHNCIINSLRLAKLPSDRKLIFPHLDYSKLHDYLEFCKEQAVDCERVIIVTDGVFSMRGDYAELGKINAMANEFNDMFKDGVIVIVDDSHGVAAYGETGRGTTEVTNADADILVGTLGKGFGVNGGYVVASSQIIKYLRETSPFYVYSNPITPGEAAAALKAVEMLTSGNEMLLKLRQNTEFFKQGVQNLGYEIIPGVHPIVALLVRDTSKTKQLVQALFERNILAVGLGYPIVPRGQETIRFQVSAAHTMGDLKYVLKVLEECIGIL